MGLEVSHELEACKSPGPHAMRRCVRFWSVVGLLLPLSVPALAFATHPDFEGERGIELQVGLGFNGWSNTSDSMSFTSSELSTGTLQAISSPGLGLRVSAGYRFIPWLSAGLTVGWNSVSTAGQYTVFESMLGAQDSYSSWQLGVYARFYVLAFVNHWGDHPRVFFTQWSDPRRIDPWVSLGVDFLSAMDRTRTYYIARTMNSWNTSYVGLPI